MWNKRIHKRWKLEDSKNKCHRNSNKKEVGLALLIEYKILFREEIIIRSTGLYNNNLKVLFIKKTSEMKVQIPKCFRYLRRAILCQNIEKNLEDQKK